MTIIGGFDHNLGVTALRDGGREIGRANLPTSARIIPDAELSRTGAMLFGRLSDSGIMERFAPYMAVEPRFRELLSPDVFFESLASARNFFICNGDERNPPGEGPLVEAARQLEQLLSDKTLCDMLRNLILKA